MISSKRIFFFKRLSLVGYTHDNACVGSRAEKGGGGAKEIPVFMQHRAKVIKTNIGGVCTFLTFRGDVKTVRM